jgi:MoaA/NifB/PqqE/SkfB family radical SAM enzyme
MQNLFIHIKITSECNFNCPYCCQKLPTLGKLLFSNGGYIDMVKLKLFIKFIYDTYAKLFNLNFIISGGEPTLHPGLIDLIDFLSNLDIKPLVHTNGSKLLNLFKINSDLDKKAEIAYTIHENANYENIISILNLSKNILIQKADVIFSNEITNLAKDISAMKLVTDKAEDNKNLPNYYKIISITEHKSVYHIYPNGKLAFCLNTPFDDLYYIDAILTKTIDKVKDCACKDNFFIRYCEFNC